MRINTKRRKCDTMMRHLVKISNILETITIVIKVHKKLPPFKSFWWVKCYGNGSKQKTGTMDYVLWTLIPLTTTHQYIQYSFTLPLVLWCFLDMLNFFVYLATQNHFHCFLVSILIIFRGLFHVLTILFDKKNQNESS